MNIFVNGEERQVAAGLSLADLVDSLSVAGERIAVELNEKVVRRREWGNESVNDGDRIEIVHFVGGG